MLKVIDGVMVTVDHCYGNPEHPANYILVALYAYNELRVLARVDLDGTISPVRGIEFLAPTEADYPVIRKALADEKVDK